MSTILDAIADPEVLAFIDRAERAWGPPGRGPGIAGERQAYDRVAAAFQGQRPAGIAVEDGVIRGPDCMLAIRRYWPAEPGPVRFLYLHGGGFSLGGLDSHDTICADIAATCGLEVVSLAYRLCPENPHPAAYRDAQAATKALADRPLLLAGDSAGGNLAAAVALTGPRHVVGQALIYPDLGGAELGLAAYRKRAAAPLLTAEAVQAYRTCRAGGSVPRDDATFNPLLAADFSRAAPCFVSSAEHDPLRDDGPVYALKLSEAGVAAEALVEPDLPHGHLRARHLSTSAHAAFGRICAAISRLAAAAGA